MARFGEREKRETKFMWFVHVRRKDDGHIGRIMLRIELPGKKKQGRPKRWYVDAVRENMAVIEVPEEDAEGITKWRWTICCGDS